jgi:hypothetical protein
MHRLSVIDLRGSFISATNSTREYQRVSLYQRWPLILVTEVLRHFSEVADMLNNYAPKNKSQAIKVMQL